MTDVQGSVKGTTEPAEISSNFNEPLEHFRWEDVLEHADLTAAESV